MIVSCSLGYRRQLQVRWGEAVGGDQVPKTHRKVLVLFFIATVALILRGDKRAVGEQLDFMEDTFPSESWPVFLGDLGQKQLNKLQSADDESGVVLGW